MFKRSSFWLGLLLGIGTMFGVCRRRQPDPLLDLVGDAVLVCNGSGTITSTNAVAQRLFGPGGKGSFQLYYPSGQPVAPGQFPLIRALKSRQSITQMGYVLILPDGQRRVLDAVAYPRSRGAVAVFQDITARQELALRLSATERQMQVLRALGHRLGAAAGMEELARNVADSALTLLDGRPDAQAKVYAYDSERKILTLLASVPEERPKRPKSLRQAQPTTAAFDATDPLLWQVYVARQPYVRDGSCALPLLANGVALGHLSVNCSVAEAFRDTGLMVALTQAAALAALMLAGQREAAQAAAFGKYARALGVIARSVANSQDRDTLADLIAKQLKQAFGCEVCTLAAREGEGFRLAGATYQEALLFPAKHGPDDPALLHSAAHSAFQTGKTVVRVGLPNPELNAGPWRAFAGQSGRHCVLAVPLAGGQGVLTIYAAGEAPFDTAQINFLETLAVLIAPAMTPASRLNS